MTATEPARRSLYGVPRPWPSLRTPILRRALPRLLAHVQGARLEIHDVDGTIHRGGPETGTTVTIHVHDANFWRRLARRGNLGLGESFVSGEWSSPQLADLFNVLSRSMIQASRSGPLALLQAVQRRRPSLGRRNDHRRARRQIGYHYDLGNDFYRTFLDPTMTYSSGLFIEPGMTLEESQRAKYRSICDKLDLQPDMHVLEIGCGWGGFALLAAQEYGVRVTGVTLSTEQHAYATELVARHGLQDRIDLQLRDYRTLNGKFDRIASIEMLEAVGAREYPNFFRTVERLLAPNGWACIQVIGFNEREYERLLRAEGWLRRYIFPGGMCPSVTALSTAMMRSTNLQLAEIEEMGQHYAPTLAIWRERVHQSWQQILDLGYDEELLRAFDYYFAYCEAGFRSGVSRNMQLIVTPSLPDAVPSRLHPHKLDIDRPDTQPEHAVLAGATATADH